MFAIILAGGKGGRLLPLTKDKPKSMVELHGKPILEYQILQLKRAGIRNIIIAESYKAEVISQYFGNGESLGVHIRHLLLDFALGNAGALKSSMEQLPENETDVLVMFCDNVSTVDLGTMQQQHLKEKKVLTILAVEKTSRYGVISPDDGRWFQEKPNFLINGGIYILNRSLHARMPEKGNFSRDVLNHITKKETSLYIHRGFWEDIADEHDLQTSALEMNALEIT